MNRPTRIDLTPLACLDVRPEFEAAFRAESELFKEVADFIDQYSTTNRRCMVSLVDNTHVSRTFSFGNIDIMMLSSMGYAIQSILYVFAHEYCHHSINHRYAGKTPTGQLDCHPLEELFCTVSSLFQMYHLADFCFRSGNEPKGVLLQGFGDYVRQYYMEEGKHPPREYIQSLSSGHLHQKDYELLENAAALILPVFRKNRSLWRALRHLGDINPETPFGDALEYLRRNADDSYRGSLDEMIDLLFS